MTWISTKVCEQEVHEMPFGFVIIGSYEETFAVRLAVRASLSTGHLSLVRSFLLDEHDLSHSKGGRTEDSVLARRSADFHK